MLNTQELEHGLEHEKLLERPERFAADNLARKAAEPETDRIS